MKMAGLTEAEKKELAITTVDGKTLFMKVWNLQVKI
jgi:hypothetical protein